MAYEKPLPMIDPDGQPYWTSAREHALRIQRCDGCGRYRFTPRSHCQHCGSDAATWEPISGRGTVYASVVMYRPPTKAWADDVPYNCSIIELDEGPHLWSSVVGLPADDVKIGDRVEVTYDDVTPEVTIPRFRPIP